MFNPKNLHWIDIESDYFEGIEYIDHIKSMKERIMHQSNYKAYKPDPKIVSELISFFKESSSKLKILTLGATWCKTCADVKPSYIKVVEAVDSPKLKVYLLGGVKTTMTSTDDDYSWAKKSPPEFHNPKFYVNQIPIAYYFNEKGDCLTRIEKYPKNGKTFEESILSIAQNYLI
ncbi:MAG: hypothetical protein GF311_01480 [Candidatus Lokiarchaeota archaeon]|nr:hypothetical protein [Candidatus Lokiarchaeota archaeon]MBD3211249.1 hypothetical protein [Candidatus Lokiarchaeota archaeon]